MSCIFCCTRLPSARACACSTRASPVPLGSFSSRAFETGVLNLVYAPGAAREGGYEEAKASLPESES